MRFIPDSGDRNYKYAPSRLPNSLVLRLPRTVPIAADDDLLTNLLLGRRGELEDGCVYLLKERKPRRALEMFRKCGESGRRLLYVTRQHPDHAMRRNGSLPVRIVWLSTTIGTDYVDPHNLNSLTTLITGFIDEANGHGSAVLLDGLEYLMINNDSERVFKFFDYLDEIVATRRVILLASIDDRAFDAKELALLERNATVLDAA